MGSHDRAGTDFRLRYEDEVTGPQPRDSAVPSESSMQAVVLVVGGSWSACGHSWVLGLVRHTVQIPTGQFQKDRL